jgi:nucleotide-binding universal stress UspA family protein
MTAEEGPFDLVVVGAHTRHGLARLWHPSAAGALVHRDHRLPVVCVPAAFAGAKPEPIPAISTVLAATDFSPLANAAVIHAYSLVRQHGGVVELCHVHEHYLPNPPFAYPAAKPTLSDDQRRTLEERLRTLIPSAAADYGITTHVTVVDGGQAAKVIAQAAERLHVNAICLGTHGRSGVVGALVGSVARGVLELAHVPVMMVRTSQAAVGRA